MSKVLVATFDDRDKAVESSSNLETFGYQPRIVTMPILEQVRATQKTTHTGNHAGAGLALGALLGAMIGFVTGSGIVPLRSLWYGGIIASNLNLTGPLATTVTGMLGGLVTGAIIGAIIGLLITRRTATAGGVAALGELNIVMTPIWGDAGQARSILAQAGVVNLHEVSLTDAPVEPPAMEVETETVASAPTLRPRPERFAFGEKIMDVRRADRRR